ncbi:hypothetical protein TcBrA4_0060280 [Trypanosoma cruzi]|nr:hypothetical protein TcBrA4_0060280 [Trypanosoma cruzi]
MVGCSVVEDGAFPQRMRQGLPWIVAAQRLVGIAAEEWPKGHGCHWSLQRCVVRLLLVDTLDIFGSDLRVRHLLGRPWSCRRIHMRGLLQRLEFQS